MLTNEYTMMVYEENYINEGSGIKLRDLRNQEFILFVFSSFQVGPSTKRHFHKFHMHVILTTGLELMSDSTQHLNALHITCNLVFSCRLIKWIMLNVADFGVY